MFMDTQINQEINKIHEEVKRLRNSVKLIGIKDLDGGGLFITDDEPYHEAVERHKRMRTLLSKASFLEYCKVIINFLEEMNHGSF